MPTLISVLLARLKAAWPASMFARLTCSGGGGASIVIEPNETDTVGPSLPGEGTFDILTLGFIAAHLYQWQLDNIITRRLPTLWRHATLRAASFTGERVLCAQNGRSGFLIAASQPNSGSATWNARKLPLATSPTRSQPLLRSFSKADIRCFLATTG